MKHISTALLLLFFSCAVSGQTASVSGMVTDRDGSAPNDSTVRLSDFRTGLVSQASPDTAGRYVFSGLEAGRYILVAVSGNGDRSEPALVELEDGEASVADLRLRSAPSITETVDVNISAGTSQPVAEVAKSVDVISLSEIDARGDVSLVDTLRSVPGFRVQQLGGYGRTASIKTRGLRNQDTAVLIDGMRFRDPSSITGDASAFLSDLPMFGAERIEVLRGSGSSVYGTNALGGVVDIRTSEPGAGLNGSFDGSAGGLGYKAIRGGLSAGTSRFGFAATAARTIFSEGIDGEDDAENNGLQARIDFRPSAGTSVSGRFLVTDTSVRLNNGPDTIGIITAPVIEADPGVNFLPDQNDPDSVQRSNILLGRVSLTHAFGPKLLFDASYQSLATKRLNENGELGPGFQPFGGTQTSTFKGRIDTLSARLNWTPSVSRLFVFGYEFEREDFENEGLGPFASDSFFTDAGQKSSTFYVQHLTGFLQGRLQLSGGARFQAFSVEDPVFSITNAPYQNLSIENPPGSFTLDGSASYLFRSTGTKLRAHVGNGYRVPSLYERLGTFYSSFSGDFTALGDPGLKPERSYAFDAGIEQDLGSRAVASATYFYTKLTDIIGFGFPVPDIGSTVRPFGGYRNEEGGLARGVEIGVRARPADSTYLFASYTHTNSDQKSPQVAGSGVVETLGIPADQFSLVVTQTVLERLTLSFDLLVSGSYLAPIFSNQSFTTVLYRFDGNRRGDFSAVYEVPVFGERARLKLRGAVQNLFDFEYFENGFRTEGRTARAGVGIQF